MNISPFPPYNIIVIHTAVTLVLPPKTSFSALQRRCKKSTERTTRSAPPPPRTLPIEFSRSYLFHGGGRGALQLYDNNNHYCYSGGSWLWMRDRCTGAPRPSLFSSNTPTGNGDCVRRLGPRSYTAVTRTRWYMTIPTYLPTWLHVIYYYVLLLWCNNISSLAACKPAQNGSRVKSLQVPLKPNGYTLSCVVL